MKANTPQQLLSKWRSQTLMVSLAWLVLFTIFTFLLYWINVIELPIMGTAYLLGVFAIYTLHSKYQPSLDEAIHLAHSQNDEIEYSAQLLVDDTSKEGLARLQKKRAENLFGKVDYLIPWNDTQIKKTVLLIVSICLGAISIQSLLNSKQHKDIEEVKSNTLPAVIVGEETLKDTALLKSLVITETPPSYTGLNKRTLKLSNINIVEGGTLKWQANIQGSFDKFYFLFSDGDTIDLTKQQKLQKQFFEPDFYQYGLAGKNFNSDSDYYGIKVNKDQKPQVLITGIEEYVRLPWDKEHIISFGINMTDDYGLTEAFISATIAKGSGEAVKFRERKFKLKNFDIGTKSYQGSFDFSTSELEMEPGDELYFYVRAKDNYPYGEHWTKSVTHFVSIIDTTTYEYADAGGMQVDLMPDFFRSQRQIIIDSEKLISEKANITTDSFNRASNALGFDQKMLRLKYGQFLGEENESGIDIDNELTDEDDHDHDHEGHDHAAHNDRPSKTLESARELLSQYMHDHDHEEEEGLLMATKGTEKAASKDPSRPTWVEELSHNHDDGEVATFHDVSLKSKLRSALSVMWDAELHLRLYDPATSLPFQYDALEMLQEIKNHARIYVHRIGFDPPAIKEGEIRLIGDQDKIESRLKITQREVDDEYESLKSLATALGQVNTLTDQEPLLGHLDSAVRSLARISLQRAEVLPVLTMANKIKQNFSGTTKKDLSQLRSQIIKIIPSEASSVNGPHIYAHELTLSVAKKITY